MLPLPRLTRLDTSVPTVPLGGSASSVWVIDNAGVLLSTGASLVPVMVTSICLVMVLPC